MAASVRIEDEAFADLRYEILGALLGTSKYDALGRMSYLWRQCTIQNSETLWVTTITLVLGSEGVSMLIEASLGTAIDDKTVRIHGTNGRIEWLQKLRKNGKYGKLGGRPKGSKSKTHMGLKNNPLGYETITPPAPAPAPTTSNNFKENSSKKPPYPPSRGDDAIASEPSSGKPRKRTVKSLTPAMVTKASASVVEAFNRVLERDLGPKGFERPIQRLLAKGYSEPQMRGVVWWAGEEWGDKPEMRDRLTPTTLFKLQSGQGYRTFPEYLECAGERWRQHMGSQPPWEDSDATR